jgi:hypothetical protein
MAGCVVYVWSVNQSSKWKSRLDMETPANIRRLKAAALVLASIGIGAGELESLKRDGVI